ncbi:homeobox expressed in ES cells 1-B [Sabethes cyaneus]|uniref:homeobox expressed in ES cells 1-B n=1 Tax=Sabethes cyaneus TaxID=53552 RepID=UPI00237DE3E2|nr:homeobox expressed in ES cells 1-B [Sabethes cyaneus]
MAQSKQSDFSIEHILTKAGEKYNKRQNENAEVPHSCSSNNSQSYSDSEDSSISEEGEIVVDGFHQAETVNSANYLQNCMPSFDWLYYTRYRPPKLPRLQKPGPIKRTPGRLPRVPFTPSQLTALEEAYKVSTYLSSEEANQLAYSLELTNTRVKIWFQNRRARDRREKRENTLGTAEYTSNPLGFSSLATIRPLGQFTCMRPSLQTPAEEHPTTETKSSKDNPF